ncbi:MAG TPA: DUF1206 domain-containing protein [Pirellulaceae bacterium]|jgi:hypothetical protein|nr:DUF1206 domain-containing protein [Pirellulaceae bacterium]
MSSATSGDLPLSREGHGWLKFVARLGYAARGAVYVIIGALALLAALGMGGETTGPQGALSTLREQPFGMLLLGAVALGLFGHAMWRFLQSAMDTDRHGHDAKGLVVRAGLFASCLAHLSLALYAASLIRSPGQGGSGEGDFTRWLMGQPGGQIAVIVIGIVTVIVGIVQIWRGIARKFEKHLVIDEKKRTALSPICRVGLVARGVVFGIIGFLAIYAGWNMDPEEAKGIDGALQTLQGGAFGRILLGAMALGLIAFAGYSFVLALYRRIETENADIPGINLGKG